ncbi:hypothetical protein GF342_03680 [Candidatus Woesearchaeota archaeon]|nr:hypothetical protein [Candidatus Woesearchaeota archaeon]
MKRGLLVFVILAGMVVAQSEPFSIECEPQAPATVWCDIMSARNYSFTTEVCIDGECQSVDLPPFGTRTITFTLQDIPLGSYTFPLHASGDGKTAQAEIFLSHFDMPKLVLKNLTAPEKVGYDEEFQVSFILEQVSYTEPRNVTVWLRGSQLLFAPQEVEHEQFTITLKGSDLHTPASITVRYEDAEGNVTRILEAVPTTVEASWWQRVSLSIRGLFYSWFG